MTHKRERSHDRSRVAKAKAYEVNYFRDVGRANGETVSTSSSSFNVGG